MTTTTLPNYDAFVVTLTDVQWLLYLQDHALVVGCSLIQSTSRCDPFTDVQWLLYQQDPGCKLPLWLSYAISEYTLHNHCLFISAATRVTTQWLKHPISFCSEGPGSVLTIKYTSYLGGLYD